MKKLLYILLSILMLSMVSCKKPEPQVVEPKPEVTISEGLITENSIEFFLSASKADEVAYCFMETTDEVPLLTVKGLFKGEDVFAASAEPVSFVMENLKPEMMAKSSLLSVRGKTMATAESVFPVRLFAS